MQEAFGPSDIHLGTALASSAEVVASQGQYARAKNLYQRALSIYLTSLGTEDPRTVRLVNEVAELLVKLNRRDEAEALKAGAPLGRPGARGSTSSVTSASLPPCMGRRGTTRFAMMT